MMNITEFMERNKLEMDNDMKEYLSLMLNSEVDENTISHFLLNSLDITEERASEISKNLINELKKDDDYVPKKTTPKKKKEIIVKENVKEEEIDEENKEEEKINEKNQSKRNRKKEKQTKKEMKENKDNNNNNNNIEINNNYIEENNNISNNDQLIEDYNVEGEEILEITSNQNSYARVAGGRNRTINLDGISLAFENKVLIEKAKLLLLPKHIYGLIGKNGSGKTTLMRKIYKKQIQSFPMHITTSICEQEMEGTKQTVLQSMMNSDPEIEILKKKEIKIQNDLENKLISIESAEEILNEIRIKLEMKKLHLLEVNAKSILKGFGFSKSMFDSPTNSLSGGFRQKLALARALFQNADVLCLDEPTNHLDIENKLFLVNYLLKKYEGTIVVVSHDTAFLESIVTDVIELRKKTLEYFPGTYHDFEVIKEDREKHRLERYNKQQRKINQSKEKMEKVIAMNTNRAKKSKKKKDAKMSVKGVKQFQSKIDRAIYIRHENGKRYKESYDGFRYLLKAEKKDKFKVFKLHKCDDTLTGTLLQVNNLTYSHDGETKNALFKNVNMLVNPGEKVAIIGKNGVGKTTFLELLSKSLEPISGSVVHHRNLKTSYFTQHHVQQLDLTMTPMQHLKNIFPLEKEEILRSHLAKFGICEYMPLQKMTNFSGGERSRVVFATITLSEPHLLILDEISNHLDLEAQISIINSLKEFNGSIIMVSHDQNLISSVCNKFWLLEDKLITELDGTFDEYIEDKMEELEEIYKDDEEDN